RAAPLRSVSTIFMPADANVRAAARPMPEAPPVMTAIRPGAMAGCAMDLSFLSFNCFGCFIARPCRAWKRVANLPKMRPRRPGWLMAEPDYITGCHERVRAIYRYWDGKRNGRLM